MSDLTDRRSTLQAMGVALAAGAATAASARPAPGHGFHSGRFSSAGPARLADFRRRLAQAPRRRAFRSVPMILDHRELWDHEALDIVLAYAGSAKQAWDVTDIAGPWLNAMRNALNAQVFAFGHADFLVVSATHGSANLALLDQTAWDKYALAQIAPKGFARNTLIERKPVAAADPHDIQNPQGLYSGANLSVPALQARGAVFLSCHNSLWELAARLAAAGTNPDRLDVDALAADLTNRLIEDVVLTPGAVATLPELQRAGFAYAR